MSFVVQGSAAGLMGKGSKAGMANDIVIGGLLVQVGTLVLFVVTAVVFDGRMRRAGMIDGDGVGIVTMYSVSHLMCLSYWIL